MPVVWKEMGVGVLEQGGDDKTVKAYFTATETACRSGQGERVDVIT